MNDIEYCKAKLQDKTRGCLVAGAVGDALGYAVEFVDYAGILGRYGVPGITRYELDPKGVAEISDDTQMTLYTACGLLNGDVLPAYIEWYQTQTLHGAMIEQPKCWISRLPEMYARRAPGGTCMSALNSLSQGLSVSNDSKGCGGIMRVAPYGLFYATKCGDDGPHPGLPVDRVAYLACEAARLTHQHPMGFLPAGLLAATILSILELTLRLALDGELLYGKRRDSIDRQEVEHCVGTALHAIINLCNRPDGYPCPQAADELSAMTRHVMELARRTDITDIDAISSLGEGWTGEEAWYIALYCALKHFDSIEDAIVAAVNHSGDSDSTGAICGNLMGAIHGYDAIPAHFKEHLELLPSILAVADDLARP